MGEPQEVVEDQTDETAPEAEETEETAGTVEPESETETTPDSTDDDEPEKEEDRVPLSRFKKIESRGLEAAEKLELLKTNPEEYYEKYPDERPEAEPEEPEQTGPLTILQAGEQLTVTMEDPEHEYHGKTLGEVAKLDPLYATDLYNKYVKDFEAQQAETDKLKAEADAQVEAVYARVKEDLSDGSDEQVEAGVKAVFDWMTENGCETYDPNHAYMLMNMDKTLSETRASTAKDTIDKIKHSDVQTISTDADDTEATGFDSYLNLTAPQMMARIQDMTDSQFSDFIKNAPDTVRSKFPTIPWE